MYTLKLRCIIRNVNSILLFFIKNPTNLVPDQMTRHRDLMTLARRLELMREKIPDQTTRHREQMTLPVNKITSSFISVCN